MKDLKSQKPRKFIDLSHTIKNGLITYKGLPAPVICDYLSRQASREFYSPGTEFQIAKIEMVSNTGTYIDCPFHRYKDGKDLSQLSIEAFFQLNALVIRIEKNIKAIDASYFLNKPIKDKAILVYTGWDRHWASDQYFENHPYLTEDAAEYLKLNGARLVGIDSVNIDDTRGRARPVHSILLKHEILIVEHLCNLNLLPEDNFLFTALPPKFAGVGTFPVRAMAELG